LDYKALIYDKFYILITLKQFYLVNQANCLINYSSTSIKNKFLLHVLPLKLKTQTLALLRLAVLRKRGFGLLQGACQGLLTIGFWMLAGLIVRKSSSKTCLVLSIFHFSSALGDWRIDCYFCLWSCFSFSLTFNLVWRCSQ